MDIEATCQNILDLNWQEKFTIPAPGLYPFQWNWDSGFIALGNAYNYPERALLEIETLFSGQWKNGFLPHILFHNFESKQSYFPSASYWDSSVSEYASTQIKSTGITQPPVHGFVLGHMLKNGLDRKRIADLFDKIINYHKYLYNCRNYKDTGLVAIWHNWESGMDNSVVWDDIFNRIPKENYIDIQFQRKDVHEVENSSETRPEDNDYKRYLFLLNELKKNKYDKVPENYPFQVLCPVFNTILIKSNQSLIKVGKELNKDTLWIEHQLEKSLNNFDNYFWNSKDELYYPYDINIGKQVCKHYIGNFIPVFAQIPEINQVHKLMKKWNTEKGLTLFPSVSPEEKGFQRKNYWRGPVWVNMNWMIWKGLAAYGLNDQAIKLKKDTITMVKNHGVYEYFDPFSNTFNDPGYGGSDFSWTAALIIDMIKN